MTDDQILTIPEACARLRVSRWTVYNLIRTGQLPTFTVGRCRRVTTQALRAYINARHDQEIA